PIASLEIVVKVACSPERNLAVDRHADEVRHQKPELVLETDELRTAGGQLEKPAVVVTVVVITERGVHAARAHPQPIGEKVGYLHTLDVDANLIVLPRFGHDLGQKADPIGRGSGKELQA